jgi:hypothetical protein
LIRGTNREIDRLEGWVFPAGYVLPNCPGKTILTGFPSRSYQFSLVGCHEWFLSRRVFVELWLFLFKGGEVLEVFSGSFGLKGVLGIYWTKLA